MTKSSVFITQVQLSISHKVSTSRITSDQDRLNQLEKEYMRKLYIDGFNKPFKIKLLPIESTIITEISKKNRISPEIVQALYDLCIGVFDSKGKNRIDLKHKNITEDTIKNTAEIVLYNLDLIKIFTVYLLSKIEPHIFIAILHDLYPYLIPQQQQIIYYIVKEIIINDKFHQCYLNKHFCEEALPAFIKAIIPRDKLDGYSFHLKEMIKLQNKIENPLIRASNQINIIIAKFDNHKQVESQKDYKLFTTDLTTIMHLHILTFKMKEWLNQGWAKENKHEIAPNLVEITKLFNKISDYVVTSILSSLTSKERMSKIEFYIRTINELINGQERPCDLQSAMAISSALAHRMVKKYLNEFKSYDNKIYELWEKAQMLLDHKDNYVAQRTHLDNIDHIAFPFLGMFAFDLTMKAENTNLKTKALNEGTVYQKLIKLKNYARGITVQEFHSNLAYVLHHQKEMTDADFELIEMKNNTFPINLDSTLTISHLINLIDVYCTKNLKLKVTYIQNLERQESEGLAAIESIFSWLKDEIPTNEINQEDIDKLVKKMELLPNTSKARIEFLYSTYVKWFNLQIAKKATQAKNKLESSEKNQGNIKKEKEHADDENSIRSSNRP